MILRQINHNAQYHPDADSDQDSNKSIATGNFTHARNGSDGSFRAYDVRASSSGNLVRVEHAKKRPKAERRPSLWSRMGYELKSTRSINSTASDDAKAEIVEYGEAS